MKKINVAIVGHWTNKAMSLIIALEKIGEIFLVPETIGKNEEEEYDSIFTKIGLNGKNIQVLSVEKIDIFLKYENLIIVDFTRMKYNMDFYNKNNIKHFYPGDSATIESILDLIFTM